LCEAIYFWDEQKKNKKKQQQRENRTFEAEGKGLESTKLCVCV